MNGPLLQCEVGKGSGLLLPTARCALPADSGVVNRGETDRVEGKEGTQNILIYLIYGERNYDLLRRKETNQLIMHFQKSKPLRNQANYAPVYTFSGHVHRLIGNATP